MDPSAPRDIERLLNERTWLRRVALALVRDETRADDLTQETYVAALERAPEHVERPRSWLGTVARNLWRNDARARKRRDARERAHGVKREPVPEPPALVERAELVERLGRMLLALREPYRTTLLLRYFEDLPPQEVARRMDVPVETVRTRVKRALAELARGFDEEPGGRTKWAPALLAWARGPEVAAVATVAGALLMKKLLVAAAVALLAVGGWGLTHGWFEGRPSPDGLPGGDLTAGERPAGERDANAPQLAGARSDTRGKSETVRGLLALSGHVIDVEGRPVAGVPVRARPPLDRWFMAFPDAPSLDKDPPSRAILAEARSGPDGEFSLTGLTHGVRYEVEAVAVAPRFGSSVIAQVWPWAEYQVVLRVGDGVPLRGRVVDLAGTGVPAWVEGSQLPAGGRDGHSTGRWHAVYLRTDAEGRFELGAVPPGPLLLSAYAPGRGARRAVPVSVPTPGELLLRLAEPDGAELVGHVLDDTGKPVVGARLSIESHPRRAGPVAEAVIVTATTDAEGAYRARGLIAGRVQDVHVEAPGYFVPGMLGYDTLLGSGHATLDIVLLRSVVIEGEVVDEANRPVAGAMVQAWPKFPTEVSRSGFGHRWSGITAATGRFRIDVLPALPVMLEAELAGHVPARSEWLLPTAAGGLPDARLVLKPLAAGSQTVRGYARRADGTPVPGTIVYAMPVMDGRAWPKQVAPVLALCAADGSFVLENLDPTRDWSVAAKGAGVASPSVALAPGGSWPPVALRLEPQHDAPPQLPRLEGPSAPSEPTVEVPARVRGPTVEVVLLGPDGQAGRMGNVMFLTGHNRREGRRTGGAGAQTGGGKFWTELQPDDKSFDVEVVTLFDAAGRRMNVRPQTFRDLEPAQSPFTFRLEAGRVLHGRVLDSGVKGVPGVRVFVASAAQLENDLRVSEQAGAAVETDAEGAFELTGLAEGELVVRTGPIAGFIEPIPVRVRADAREVVVHLERGVGLSGRVVDPDGKPVVGSYVRARLPRTTSAVEARGLSPSYVEGGWGAQTDAKGAFAFSGIPPEAQLSVWAEGPEPWLPTGAVETAAGQDDVVLHVTAGAFVEGEVLGDGWEDTEPLVVLRKVGAPRNPYGVKAQGLGLGQRHFRVGPVEPGTYDVVVLRGADDLVVESGVTAPARGLRLTLPRPRHVVGRIVGENVRGFQLHVFFESTNLQTSVDASGAFRVTNVRPGRVTVFVFRDGDERYGLREDVDPTAGSIEVTLQQGLTISGRVTDLPSGEPVSIEVAATGSVVWHRTQGSEDGRFRIVGLRPGKYDLRVECRVGKRYQRLTAEEVVAGGPEVVLPFTAR